MSSTQIEFSILHARIDPETARIVSQHPLVLRWVLQRDSSWSIAQKLAMLDTVFRGWACTPIYLLKRGLDKNITENLFDGAHKLEALHEFVKGEYVIKPLTEGWDSSPLKNYVGKKFKELPDEMQDTIRKYKFQINYISDADANNPDTLSVLWARLNNAGTPLNGYELKIPVFGELHRILEDISAAWTETHIYTKAESKRGSCEEKLYQLLALSDDIPSFSSLPGLAEKWRIAHGKNTSEINEKIQENKGDYVERLSKMRSILRSLEEHGAFRNENEDIEMADYRIPLLIFIGRLGYWFEGISQFNIHASAISAKLKNEIFLKSADDNVKLMNCTSRNAKFQAALITYIDDILRSLSVKKRRLFTKKEKKIVLKNQGGKCAMCKEKLAIEHCHGDHILPFSAGGETTVENCQVLHEHCHRSKGI